VSPRGVVDGRLQVVGVKVLGGAGGAGIRCSVVDARRGHRESVGQGHFPSAIGEAGSKRSRASSGLVPVRMAMSFQLAPLARAVVTASGRARRAWSMRLASRWITVRSSPSQALRRSARAASDPPGAQRLTNHGDHAVAVTHHASGLDLMRAGDGQQGASDGPQSWLGVILACRLAAARPAQRSRTSRYPGCLMLLAGPLPSIRYTSAQEPSPRRDGGPAHKAVEAGLLTAGLRWRACRPYQARRRVRDQPLRKFPRTVPGQRNRPLARQPLVTVA